MKPGRILLSQTQIRSRVRELGRALTRRYRGKNVLVLGVMNGALFFLADLLRSLELDDAQIACVSLASYTGVQSTGLLRGLEICVLLAKRRKRDVPVRADWTGFTIDDEFVVGYGLDYNGRYRALKQIRVLEG